LVVDEQNIAALPLYVSAVGRTVWTVDCFGWVRLVFRDYGYYLFRTGGWYYGISC
jgi:hypothetical protein